MIEPELELAAKLAINSRIEPRPLHSTAGYEELRENFAVGLPIEGRDGKDVIRNLVEAATPGLSGSTDPGFLAWVIGGSSPTGVAADWLTSAWGQNSGMFLTAPAAAVAEEVAGEWLVDLMRLPTGSSVGFSSGATMAAFSCLAAARHSVLARKGIDIEECGLVGAPPVAIYIADDGHVSNYSVLRYLGFGSRQIRRIKSTQDGTFDLAALEAAMAQDDDLPRIVIGQAGHIMSGGFDDFPALARLCRKHDAWLHVDGAFGLWCRASPRLRYLAKGVDLADSWSVDGHKWLQVPYDSGFAIVKDRDAHRAAMRMTAGYIQRESANEPDPSDYVPELSRRARGFAAWAVLQQLGRRGVAEMIERHCRAAKLIASTLEQIEGIVLRNDVVLNQIAIGFEAPADLDAPEIVAKRLNGTGRYFLRTALWRGEKVLRISVISDRVDEHLATRLASDMALVWRMIISNNPETKETRSIAGRHMVDTSAS